MKQARYWILAITIVVLAVIGLGGCNTAQDDVGPSDAGATELSTAETQSEDEVVQSATEDDSSTEPDVVSAEYAIVPGESTARFELDEDLRGSLMGWGRGIRFTVIGTTDQVSGTFSLSPANLSEIHFDTIRIDASSFSTSDFYRTVAVKRQILEAAAYPFIIFTPTEVRGLPERAEIGEAVSFHLDGELAIRDISLPQSFTITATVVSPGRIEGTAATVVNREAYELKIPGVTHVSNVEDEVELYIDFVALDQR